jgi:hypothetical protein
MPLGALLQRPLRESGKRYRPRSTRRVIPAIDVPGGSMLRNRGDFRLDKEKRHDQFSTF